MQKVTIPFSLELQATAVLLAPQDKLADAIPLLGLDLPAMVILVLGSTRAITPQQSAKLTRLFESLYEKAAEVGAIVIFGGTEAGILTPLGAARTNFTDVPLLGIAPIGQVSYPGYVVPKDVDPTTLCPLNSGASHFLLPPGDDFAATTPYLFSTARAVSNGCPIVALLAGGGAIAQEEIEECAIRRFPVMVIKGLGNLSDRIADALGTGSPPDDLVELLCHPEDYTVLQLDAGEDILTPWIGQKAVEPSHKTDEQALRTQWATYVQCDQTASREQRSFFILEMAILILGVVVTLVSIFSSFYPELHQPAAIAQTKPLALDARFVQLLSILLPLVVSLLIAYLTYFKPGNKWTLLRGAAEAIKREIFKYRTGTGVYRRKPGAKTTPEDVLAENIGAIAQSIQQSEVNVIALEGAGDHPLAQVQRATGDNSLSPLSGADYTKFRVRDQIAFFGSKTKQLDKQLRILRFLILLVGASGSALAALGAPNWVALTTAVATALAAYIGVKQIEPTLTKYNQTGTDLATLATRFETGPVKRRYSPAALDDYVLAVEQTLEREIRGWVQQMQEALKDVTKSETAQGPKDPVPPHSADSPTGARNPAPVAAPETSNQSTSNQDASNQDASASDLSATGSPPPETNGDNAEGTPAPPAVPQDPADAPPQNPAGPGM